MKAISTTISVPELQDNGNTWSRVHGVSGKTDKRTAQMDVSSLAGHEILIGLKFKSNDFFESTGWTVFGLDLIIGKSVKPVTTGRASRTASTSGPDISQGTSDDGYHFLN